MVRQGLAGKVVKKIILSALIIVATLLARNESEILFGITMLIMVVFGV